MGNFLSLLKPSINTNTNANANNNSNMSSESENFINNETSSHQVVIFSKTYCGFCTSVKGIFSKPEFAGVSVVIHELDSMPNGTAIQQALASMTGQRTVPNVFVKGNHVGGNDDVQQAYRSGNLLSMLELK